MTKRGMLGLFVVSILMVGLATSTAIADDMAGMDMSGDSASADTGPMAGMGKHMDMGPHMTMTPMRPATPEDSARAAQIMQVMREQLSKYQDYKVAEADGY